MSSSRSRPSKKDLNEYKKLSGKDAKGRLSWDTQALKNKLDQLRGSTTATTYNITNNNYYSKSPQTEKKAKNLKKVENGRLGSTTKVKEGTHLCSRRSEKRESGDHIRQNVHALHLFISIIMRWYFIFYKKNKDLLCTYHTKI